LMHAMSGNFDEARRLGATARGICEELEWRFLLGAGVPQVDGQIELLAGDPIEAERVMRPGYEMLVEMGEKSNLSTVAAMLAEALYRQGNDTEAERFSIVSEEAAALEDVAAQVAWRGTRAKVLARRGRDAMASDKSAPRQPFSASEQRDKMVWDMIAKERADTDAKTARLKALRLAKEEAERQAAPAAAPKKAKRARPA